LKKEVLFIQLSPATVFCPVAINVPKKNHSIGVKTRDPSIF